MKAPNPRGVVKVTRDLTQWRPRALQGVGAVAQCGAGAAGRMVPRAGGHPLPSQPPLRCGLQSKQTWLVIDQGLGGEIKNWEMVAVGMQ